MAETWDYAKLGRTTWRCQVWLDNGHDSYARLLAGREITGARSRGLARGFVNRTLRKWQLADPDATCWGRIKRGTYQDDSFDDDLYGLVLDASWEPDERAGEPIAEYAVIYSDGRITWDAS